MMRIGRVLATIAMCAMCVGTASAQLQIGEGITIRGGIDPASSPLVSFGSTSDVVYVGVTFHDTLLLANGVLLRSRGMTDAVVMGFDAQWRLQFYDHVGGPGMDSIVALTAIPSGYCAAAFATCGGTIAPTTVRVGGITFTGRGGADVVTSVWSSNGTPQWSRLDGGELADLPSALTSDNDGDLIITGTYVRSTRFGTHAVSDAAQTSAFVARIDRAGTVAWLRSTSSHDNDPGIPRGAAMGGALCSIVDGTVYATAEAAGVIGFGSDTTKDVSFDFATLPYLMQCRLSDGEPLRWQRMDGCRGDSIAGIMRGTTLISAVVEPRSCQAGTEPVVALRIGSRTVRYTPGGPRTNVRAAAAREDGSMVFGGRFERTMLFDTLSRAPDLLAQSFTLQDGWIAGFEPSGQLRHAVALRATQWSEVTSIATRGRDMAVAAVVNGTIPSTSHILGWPDGVSIVIVRIDVPPVSVQTEAAQQTGEPVDIWTIDGRSAGTDIHALSPGVYVARRQLGAPYPVHVGIMRR